MDFVQRMKNMEDFLNSAFNQKIPTVIFLERLSEFKLDHNTDILSLVVELLLLNLSSELKKYLLDTVPVPYENLLKICSEIGYDNSYLDLILTNREFSNKEKKNYAEYPSWVTNKKTDKTVINDIESQEFDDKFDLINNENADMDDVLENITNITKDMICLNPIEFQLRGPKNGEKGCEGGCYMFDCECFYNTEDDEEDENSFWYTGECGKCGLHIRNIKHAIRFPVEGGGWKGCFCGMICMMDSDIIKDSYVNSRFEMMFSQLEVYGILDPLDNKKNKEEKKKENKKESEEKKEEEVEENNKLVEQFKDFKIEEVFKDKNKKFEL